jgi:hypothetical protein
MSTEAPDAGELPDMSNVHHIDTTGLTVQEWEAIKTQFSRAGWHYAPHLMVMIHLPDQAAGGDDHAR